MPMVNVRELALDMLTTQLMAAKVYAAFLRRAPSSERPLWASMLRDEFEHAAYLAELQGGLPDVDKPSCAVVRLAPFRQAVNRALGHPHLTPLQRLVVALRLEHAEMDHGLESVALQPDTRESLALFGRKPPIDESLVNHYRTLLRAAAPFRDVAEIGAQMARILEHYPYLLDDADARA